MKSVLQVLLIGFCFTNFIIAQDNGTSKQKNNSSKEKKEKFVFSRSSKSTATKQKEQKKEPVLKIDERAKSKIILSGTSRKEDLPKNYKSNFRKYLKKKSTEKKALKARSKSKEMR